jgi:hypothetical protein
MNYAIRLVHYPIVHLSVFYLLCTIHERSLLQYASTCWLVLRLFDNTKIKRLKSIFNLLWTVHEGSTPWYRALTPFQNLPCNALNFFPYINPPPIRPSTPILAPVALEKPYLVDFWEFVRFVSVIGERRGFKLLLSSFLNGKIFHTHSLINGWRAKAPSNKVKSSKANHSQS